MFLLRRHDRPRPVPGVPGRRLHLDLRLRIRDALRVAPRRVRPALAELPSLHLPHLHNLRPRPPRRRRLLRPQRRVERRHRPPASGRARDDDGTLSK